MDLFGELSYRGDYREIMRCIRECNYQVPIWEVTVLITKIKRFGKKLLKLINSKARTVIRLQRARESHKRVFLEEEEEQ